MLELKVWYVLQESTKYAKNPLQSYCTTISCAELHCFRKYIPSLCLHLKQSRILSQKLLEFSFILKCPTEIFFISVKFLKCVYIIFYRFWKQDLLWEKPVNTGVLLMLLRESSVTRGWRVSTEAISQTWLASFPMQALT